MKIATQACHPCGSDFRLTRNWKACCLSVGSAWGCHAMEMAFSICAHAVFGQLGCVLLEREGEGRKGTRDPGQQGGAEMICEEILRMPYLALHFLTEAP